MKKFRFRILCVILSVVTCLSLFTACGGGNNGGKLNDLDLRFDENGDPIFNDITLNVWSVIGLPDNVYLNRVAESFNDYYKNNGVKVVVRSMNESNFYKSLPSTLRTDKKNAPDMVLYHSERLTYFASSGIIAPIEEYLTAAKNPIDRNDYLPNVISECVYKNDLYGIPLDEHAGVYFARNDVLEKNGLSFPTTLQELVSVCNTLITLNRNSRLWYRTLNSQEWKKGKLENFYPLSMEYDNGIATGWIPETALLQNGGSMSTADGKPGWNNDNLAKILQIIRDWWKGENSYPDEFTYSGAFIQKDAQNSTMWQRFADCNTVFAMEGPWQIETKLNEFEELSDKEDQDGNKYQAVEIMNLSKLFALDPTASYADKVYGVGHVFSLTSVCTENAERAVAAAIFAKFMSENSINYLQGGHLPAYKRTLESEELKSKDFYNKYVKKICDPTTLEFLGNTKNFTEVYEELKSAFSDNLSTQASFVSLTAKDILQQRYRNALDAISANEDL